MYDMITTSELIVLQNMLFESAEGLYRVAGLTSDDLELAALYRATHKEIAHLFIEAGSELIVRLDEQLQAA
jgi:hypothetical protein